MSAKEIINKFGLPAFLQNLVEPDESVERKTEEVRSRIEEIRAAQIPKGKTPELNFWQQN